MKKILVLLVMMLGLVVLFSGCVRWPGEPGPEPGETEYQLKITVEVAGVINSSDGIYYIVIDADEDSAAEPGSDFFFWGEDFYYIKLDDNGFYFGQKKDESLQLFSGESDTSGDKIQLTIALSDLGSPSSIDINVITTDLENDIYDYLDPYFTISTVFDTSVTRPDSPGDSGDGADFDIVKVIAVITTY